MMKKLFCEIRRTATIPRHFYATVAGRNNNNFKVSSPIIVIVAGVVTRLNRNKKEIKKSQTYVSYSSADTDTFQIYRREYNISFGCLVGTSELSFACKYQRKLPFADKYVDSDGRYEFYQLSRIRSLKYRKMDMDTDVEGESGPSETRAIFLFANLAHLRN